MSRKKRELSKLETIAETLNVEALRLRLEIPSKRAAMSAALDALYTCRRELLKEIRRIELDSRPT